MAKNCLNCLRVCVILLNFIFVVIGLALLALAIYCYVDPTSRNMRNADTKFRQPIEIALYVLMAVGVIIVLVGTFGCCGAYHESECLLGTYFACVLIIFVAEVAAVGLGFIFRKSFIGLVDKVMGVMSDSYDSNPKGAVLMDTIQSSFNCCGWTEGADTYRDNKKSDNYKIPKSCCPKPEHCDAITNKIKVELAKKAKTIYTTNCSDGMMMMVKKNMLLGLLVLGGIAFVQFLAMVLACSLCCCVNRRYTDSGYVGVNT